MAAACRRSAPAELPAGEALSPRRRPDGAPQAPQLASGRRQGLKFRRFGAAAGKNIAVCRCSRLLDLTDVIIFRELGRCFCWNFTLHPHRSEDDALKQYVAMGRGVMAGAVLLEAALVPGLVIGGAAVLAPKVLPALRRRMQSARDGMDRRRAASAAPQPKQADDVDEAAGVLARFGIGRAVAKTITFRVIVTTL